MGESLVVLPGEYRNEHAIAPDPAIAHRLADHARAGDAWNSDEIHVCHIVQRVQPGLQVGGADVICIADRRAIIAIEQLPWLNHTQAVNV